MGMDEEADIEPIPEDVPEHVLRWEKLLDRNAEGYEPLDSWETADVAKAFDCLATELRLRGMETQECRE